MGPSSSEEDEGLDGRFAVLRRNLKPEFRPFMDAHAVGLAEGEIFWDVVITLRDYLLASEGLPEIPPNYLVTFGSGTPH